MSRSKDILGVLRGVQLIAEAGARLQQSTVRQVWKDSNLRVLVEDCLSNAENVKKSVESSKDVSNVTNSLYEAADRVSTVLHGLRVYTTQSGRASSSTGASVLGASKSASTAAADDDFFQSLSNDDKDEAGDEISIQEVGIVDTKHQFKIRLTESDKELLKKLDMEHRAKLKKEQQLETKVVARKEEDKMKKEEKRLSEKKEKEKEKPLEVGGMTAVPNPKAKQKLSASSKQRKVPSSRIGRMVSFGSLAAGLGLGTAAEYARRTLGLAGDSSSGDPSTLFLSQGNLDRIVDTLCKVRGAALKLGQLMSIQDDSVINPQLAKALERVRKSADFMPNWQVEQMMTNELGPNWRSHFAEFEEKPFAAASIGQVHLGKLRDGREVAVKIQYPGVAKGIESDIDNLAGIMKLWNIFPRGMFLDNLMTVAKRELAWEVDYEREAECTRRFRELLRPYPVYHVPDVIDDLSKKQVFTTELLNGIPVDQCFDLDQEHRTFIAEKIMELTLLELLEFRYMQTDPNWANFLYDPQNRRLLLLDFGASREYSKEFMNKYVKILKAACDMDRETVLVVSKELGFLTGYESKMMQDAHVDAVMILGEVFRCPQGYDFAAQDMTARIQHLVPTLLTHRLCPPPEEVYSLHRKLSGIFLLCSKLRASISCRDKFLTLYNKYVDSNQII